MSCRSSGGRAFHTLGPAAEKLLSPKLQWVRGATQVLSLADRSRRRPLSATSWTSSARYWGACPDSDLYIKQPSLKWIRWRTGSQCNSRRTGVMWSRRLATDTHSITLSIIQGSPNGPYIMDCYGEWPSLFVCCLFKYADYTNLAIYDCTTSINVYEYLAQIVKCCNFACFTVIRSSDIGRLCRKALINAAVFSRTPNLRDICIQEVQGYGELEPLTQQFRPPLP